MWDLTQLLTTGRPSDALADFLGSGEQMSERVCISFAPISLTECLAQGIQRWESIMADALIKLRDHTDKRLVPAFQRLHLVLEELNGWQSMYAFCTSTKDDLFNLCFLDLHSPFLGFLSQT